jgi:hypothetical protein
MLASAGIGAGETALGNVDGTTVAAAHNAMRGYVGDPAHGLVLSAGGLVGTFLRVNPSAVTLSNDDAPLFICPLPSATRQPSRHR